MPLAGLVLQFDGEKNVLVHDMLGDYFLDNAMNERIKELMDEAVSFHWDHDAQMYEAQIHPEDLEYFAELIVKECANVIHKRIGPKSALDVLEHFGVE